jgi:hypothetical protein
MITFEWVDNGLVIDGLPVYVADNDFIEHLYEMGYAESIDAAEMYEEWAIWERENVA